MPAGSQLEAGPDVAAVLRPEEANRVQVLRDIERLRCATCGEWIDADSVAAATVSIALEEGSVGVVQFSHAACSPSRAELARLVVIAQAEPLGIHYVQARHPQAGAVLLWERKLDLRVRRLDGEDEYLYLDPDHWEGFHPPLADEPVRLLPEWLLARDGDDLVLSRGGREVERFYDAIDRAPPGWLDSLDQSGFCLLVVSAGIGLERPDTGAIQRALRERRALMGLAEFAVTEATNGDVS